MRLLLISNSTLFGSGYLDHCAAEIHDFIGDLQKVVFVPYALQDHDGYTSLVRERFSRIGYDVLSVHEITTPSDTIANAPAVFIGGGNTFLLLKALYENNLFEAIHSRIMTGTPYIGTSAGANIACPTINTTNDMPIVYPPTFTAFGFVPFNINPHFLDTDPNSTHRGETREERIREFMQLNRNTVVGLREGALLRIENNRIFLKGNAGAKVFRPDEEPGEYTAGARLDFLFTEEIQ
jgi:dipeptidase E